MPISHRTRVAVAVLLPLTVAACSSGPAPAKSTAAPTAAVAAASPSPSAAPTEGPATAAHTYPDGLTVKVTGIERLDAKLGDGLTPDQALVKATVALTNTGAQAWDIPGFPLWTALYGPNRTEAKPVSGVNGDDSKVKSENPTQVAPGQTVTVFASSAVPAAQLGDLAVRFDAENGAPFTFTGAQSLLKG